MSYVGRFAPSPTGPLHAGSLVAALASYLDARAHQGSWLLRIEDVDETRTIPDAAQHIMQCLRAMGMQWDGDVLWQSHRKDLYTAACEQLKDHVYPCGCSRSEIADSIRRRRAAYPETNSNVVADMVAADGAPIYPGTCRHGLAAGTAARVLRVSVPEPDDRATIVRFSDRLQGMVSQHLAHEVGDFVLRRADGFWAYQLAVVVDDAQQGVTDIVRGADLLESTARQIYLQRLLGYPAPRYLHVPTLNNANGEKLSKQTGAQALDLDHPLSELKKAALFLGLEAQDAATLPDFHRIALASWRTRYCEHRQ